MEDAQIILERHEQRIRAIERDISDLKAVQAEIRTMNETLVTLATELKHTNEHLARHEQKIDAIESQPRMRMQQIVTAIIAALAGGLISAVGELENKLDYEVWFCGHYHIDKQIDKVQMMCQDIRPLHSKLFGGE